MADSAGKLRVSETRAKQGLRGLHVFWVLAISTTLAGLALIAVWWFNSGALAGAGGEAASRPAAESSFNAAPSAARQTPATPS